MDYRGRYYKKAGLALCMFLFLTGMFSADVLAAARNFNKASYITITEKQDYPHTKKFIWIQYKAPNDGYITITAQAEPEKEPEKKPDKDGKTDTDNKTDADNKADADEAADTDEKPDAGEKPDADEKPDAGDTADPSLSSAKKTQNKGNKIKEAIAKGTFCLFDSRKKTAFSDNSDYSTAESSDVSYGVKKGAVYYLRVKPIGAVKLRCKFTKVSESSGDQKSNARILEKDQQIKGVIPAGDSACDWYRIIIAKKQVLHLYYSGITNEKIKFTISGKFLRTANRYVVKGKIQTGHSYSLERLQCGSYYIKVEKNSEQASGYYTLKWK